MEIRYKFDLIPAIETIIELYIGAGLSRPTEDHETISKMYDNSNLIVTAWDEEKLVGISRSRTDFCYCCYLSELVVRKEYNRSVIGKRLIELTKEKVGVNCMLLLLSAQAAMDYYPKFVLKKS